MCIILLEEREGEGYKFKASSTPARLRHCHVFGRLNTKQALKQTAMLRVLSDIVTSADQQRLVTLLGALDMSTAFACVDLDLL